MENVFVCKKQRRAFCETCDSYENRSRTIPLRKKEINEIMNHSKRYHHIGDLTKTEEFIIDETSRIPKAIIRNAV